MEIKIKVAIFAEKEVMNALNKKKKKILESILKMKQWGQFIEPPVITLYGSDPKYAYDLIKLYVSEGRLNEKKYTVKSPDSVLPLKIGKETYEFLRNTGLINCGVKLDEDHYLVWYLKYKTKKEKQPEPVWKKYPYKFRQWVERCEMLCRLSGTNQKAA